MSGEETELDKGVIEKITDPLVHLIRNAIDHGIEAPEERIKNNKPAHGTINLIAYQIGNSVCVEVEDDGRGLDRERILGKAVESGLTKAGARLTDEEVYSFIFLPGFSTTEKVTDISGRGVGLDVVKRNIGSLEGKVTVLSRPGAGTTFSIRLPLTLAIIDGLVARIGKDIYVIPLTSVVESLRPAKDDLKSLSERGEVVQVRGEYIPLIRLYEELGIKEGRREASGATVVVAVHEDKKCCLLVDELMGQQQIVIKKLGASLSNVRGIAGGTILGDGKVALILDVAGLIENTLVSA
jgi:two-component system chemotaxis sensor kinase CheA